MYPLPDYMTRSNMENFLLVFEFIKTVFGRDPTNYSCLKLHFLLLQISCDYVTLTSSFRNIIIIQNNFSREPVTLYEYIRCCFS